MATPESMVEEISKLSVEQLRQVKEQVDGEVSVLQDSLNNIRTAANRFEMASKALNMLSQQPPGNKSAGTQFRFQGHMWNREPPLQNVFIRNTLHRGACIYCRGGKKMLVPLTASLYASGTLANTDNVLVDVGTGYFIEKSLPDGKDYCERKIKFLKENHQKLVEVANGKQNAAEQVNMVLQAKMRSAAQPARG